MRSLQIRLSVALVAILIAALAFLSVQTANRAEGLLLPEVERKAETVAGSITSLIDRALEVGIPFSDIQGLEPYLSRVLAANPDFQSIGIEDLGGRQLFSVGTRSGAGEQPGVRLPIGAQGAPVAYVSVGLDPAFAQEIVYKLWIDLAIVMVVTALVALELVYISFGAGLYGIIEGVEARLHSLDHEDLRKHPPVNNDSEFGRLANLIDGRLAAVNQRYMALRDSLATSIGAARRNALELVRKRFKLGDNPLTAPLSVVAIRAPLFVFMFAEELTRPFLPIYIQRIATPIPGLSPQLVISLPMVVFLAIVALTQPVLGGLTERFGRRRSLICGAAFGVAGYCASAFAYDILGLALARGLAAIGFALVFVSAQGYVIDSTSTSQRARGMAVFIGAILVAGLCGPPIGGIIADRLGIEAAFLIAACMAGASLLLALICIPEIPGHKPSGPPIRWRDFTATLSSPSLAVLLFCCAMPAKIILVAFCFFLIPLHMEALGQDQAAIGRMLMIYPLIMVMLVPTFASLADKWNARLAFVAGGGLIAGLGSLVVLIDATNVFVLGTMLLFLGIGQAISIAPQSALVGEFGRDTSRPVGDGALYGIFRLVERTGNALGPVIAGFLLGLYGFTVTVVLIGALMAVGSICFGATTSGFRSRKQKPVSQPMGSEPA
ncbi:putative MFS family arabinose efflux permease [Rhodoligotrophos appendicifer]|uniref:MFS transporter n=1 Tax=Rhodoligotrophos appendicifer TaxID=987056 RepID=UPI00117C367A|nr:MFS transporter [Rhodoligotrophos appendicifer]